MMAAVYSVQLLSFFNLFDLIPNRLALDFDSHYTYLSLIFKFAFFIDWVIR